MQKTLAIALLVLLLVPAVYGQYEFRFKEDQQNFLRRGSRVFQGMYIDDMIMYAAVFMVFFLIFWQGIRRIGFEKKIGLVLAMSLAVIATIPTMRRVSTPEFSRMLSGMVPQQLLSLIFLMVIGFVVYKLYGKLKGKPDPLAIKLVRE